jgi:hypothetical protein
MQIMSYISMGIEFAGGAAELQIRRKLLCCREFQNLLQLAVEKFQLLQALL